MLDFLATFSLSTFVGLLAALFFLTFVAQKVYYLYFHPLADIPGPKLWAVSRLPFVTSMLRGTFAQDIRRIHEKYGGTVRLAPNELSYAVPEAWHDVYDQRSDHPVFLKNPMWLKLPDGRQDPGMGATTNEVDHTRMRKLMDTAFTYKALKAQEATIQSYVSLLITRLRERAGPDGGIVNAVDWFNFITFDIVGDLGFGESFGCLQNSHYHWWVNLITKYFKAAHFAAMTRYYPAVEAIAMRLLPQRLLKEQRDHYQHTVDKIHRRLNLETQRNDFVTPVIKDNKDMQIMSMPEIESTLNVIIVAGSETTATTLSGITNYLIQYPKVRAKLAAEVREKFSREEEITMAATRTLPYLNAVISEGLRICTPTPGGMPRVTPPGGGSVCGRWLPENTCVSVSSWALYFNPAYFSKPEEFIPERWFPAASRPAEIVNHHQAAAQYFSVGPRSCIGKEIALTELRLILARMMWNFDITAEDESKILDWSKLETQLLVQKQPVMVRLKIRN